MESQPTDKEIENAILYMLDFYEKVFTVINGVNALRSACILMDKINNDKIRIDKRRKPVGFREIYDFEWERLNKRYANHHNRQCRKR